MYLLSEMNVFSTLLLLFMWTLAGWLITARTFAHSLLAHERGLISLGIGLVIGTWLANWLARFLPPTAAFWSAALLSGALGVLLSLPLKKELFPKEALQLKSWIFFFIFALIFTLIGRGFGFFDDHQNLAPVSIMAAGDIPPHFSYNPTLSFGYHYFLLLVAAQFVRISNAAPWTALDLARGITLALTLSYGGFLAYRITRSRLTQFFSMVFMAFAGGARWLFFLLPAVLQRQVSSSIQLIGSGADTGPNLITAIYKYWKIEGTGPLAFPFMTGSGLDPSFSMFHNGWGTSAIMIALLLILLTKAGLETGSTERRGRFQTSPADPAPISKKMADIFASIPIIILLASMALANEVSYTFLYAGLIFAAIAWMIQNGSWRLPSSLWRWVGIMAIAGVLALIQGGMFTEIARGLVENQIIGRMAGTAAAANPDTYFKVSFALGPPTFLSAHLGYLSLLNPLQWVAILGETGLAIFALPIVLKQLPIFSRDEKWLEAAWIGSIIFSLLTIFIQYTGNAGATAASRMQAHFLTVIKIYAVPLLWVWASKKSENIQSTVFAWGFFTILSGLSIFGLQLSAMPNPVYAIYLDQLDAQMFTRQWEKLTPKTMVFDPVYPRAATVLGRPIRSSKTMGETLPEWNTLSQHPDPYQLKSAGYDYLYVDLKYLNKYSTIIQQDCAKMIDSVQDKNGTVLVDGRYLYQLSSCVNPGTASGGAANP